LPQSLYQTLTIEELALKKKNVCVKKHGKEEKKLVGIFLNAKRKNEF
jgi:hypothetical protein